MWTNQSAQQSHHWARQRCGRCRVVLWEGAGHVLMLVPLLSNAVQPLRSRFPRRWWYTVHSQASSRRFHVGCGWMRMRPMGWLRGSCMKWSLSVRKNKRVRDCVFWMQTSFIQTSKLRVHLPPAAEYPWSLWIWTSDVKGAGTDAQVFLQIYGEKGKSDEIKLENNSDSFEQAQVDKFMVSPVAPAKQSWE